MTGASVQERTVIAVGELGEADQYKLLSVAVQPRPIAWVSTVSASGRVNLAPYSFFTVASRQPPTVLISVGPREGGGVKDTLANARETGEMVVNIAGAESADAVAECSAPVGPEIDEFVTSGAEPIPSTVVSPPTVAESLVALECRIVGEVSVGTDVLLLGEVLTATTRGGLLDERLHVDIEAHPYLGRLAGPYFATDLIPRRQRTGMGTDRPLGSAGGRR